MDKLNLNTNMGIAGEFNLASEEDILNLVPYQHKYSWCDGQNVDRLSVWAVPENGKRFKLSESESLSDASNHIPDWHGEEAPSIGVQIAGKNVSYLVFEREHTTQNDSSEYEEYYIIKNPPNIGRVRRRIEDMMRKNETAVLEAAVKLNIKFA